jgi:hypothetical protein
MRVAAEAVGALDPLASADGFSAVAASTSGIAAGAQQASCQGISAASTSVSPGCVIQTPNQPLTPADASCAQHNAAMQVPLMPSAPAPHRPADDASSTAAAAAAAAAAELIRLEASEAGLHVMLRRDVFEILVNVQLLLAKETVSWRSGVHTTPQVKLQECTPFHTCTGRNAPRSIENV